MLLVIYLSILIFLPVFALASHQFFGIPTLGFGFIGLAIIPIVIIVAVVALAGSFIRRWFGKGKKSQVLSENWYIYPALSKEDAVSQFLFLFAVLFFGIALLLFNQD